jgi:hypothetical protein
MPFDLHDPAERDFVSADWRILSLHDSSDIP